MPSNFLYSKNSPLLNASYNCPPLFTPPSYSILQTLLSPRTDSKQFLLGKLEFALDEICSNLSVLSAESLKRLETVLESLVDKSLYQNSIKLWITFYRIKRTFDPKTAEEMHEYYTTTDYKNPLPAESLETLRAAHDALSEKECCLKEEVFKNFPKINNNLAHF